MNCEEYEILLSARLDGGAHPGRRRPGWRPTWPSAPSACSWPRNWRPSRPKRPPLTQEVPRALQENLEGRDWSRPPDGDRPFQKEETSAALGRLRRSRRRPDGFGFTHLALPGGSSGLSEGFAALSPAGDREESTATAEDSTQSADPEEEASRPDRRRHPSG